MQKEYFVHLDGDNFFVSCELVRYPNLRDKPVVVGRERGAAVAMNAAAKSIGVTRGMPVSEIKKYFKGVTVLPSHFESYQTFSKRIGDIVREYSNIVENYSIDEYFFLYKTSGNIVTEMENLKNKISNTLGITVSIGVSNTKVLAKLATAINKPNGVTYINDQNKNELLSRVPTQSIWGIGRSSAPLWKNRGYLFASDFLSLSELDIEKESLPTRRLIYELKGENIFGINQSISPQKSYQSTESFFSTKERMFVYSEVFRHTEALCRKLWSYNGKTGYISVLLRTKDRRYQTHSINIKPFTDDFRAIFKHVETLFDELYNSNETYSKTGVTFGSISYKVQASLPVSLFDKISINTSVESDLALEKIQDALKAKFGSSRLISIASAKKSHERKKEKKLSLNRIDNYTEGLPLIYLGKCF